MIDNRHPALIAKKSADYVRNVGENSQQNFDSKLQIALVAARRPDLLEQTLSSFTKHLFCNFDVTKAFINLDPIFGSANDHRDSIDCIRSYLPHAVIREPDSPSFGAAVKWLWQQIDGPLMLHMEDDWQLISTITPQQVQSVLRDSYSAATLVCKESRWNGRDEYVWIGGRKKLLGFIRVHQKVPFLGTSPKFIRGELARQIGDLLDPAQDPEKQMLPQHNRAIFDLFDTNRCGFIAKGRKTPVIKDLGRKWREQRSIVKTVEGAKTSWHTVETNE